MESILGGMMRSGPLQNAQIKRDPCHHNFQLVPDIQSGLLLYSVTQSTDQTAAPPFSMACVGDAKQGSEDKGTELLLWGKVATESVRLP